MKFDYTPFIHGAIAVACQLIVWSVFANPWLGALLACTWWDCNDYQSETRYRSCKSSIMKAPADKVQSQEKRTGDIRARKGGSKMTRTFRDGWDG